MQRRPERQTRIKKVIKNSNRSNNKKKRRYTIDGCIVLVTSRKKRKKSKAYFADIPLPLGLLEHN